MRGVDPMELDSRLDTAWCAAQLADCAVGHTLMCYSTVDSTMIVAAQLARDPATRSGTVVVADWQSAGRGRRGRSWETPPGCALLLSVLLKPLACALPPTHATMAAGLALVEAVADCAPELATRLWLKWPNDLLVGAAPARAAKAAGILTEAIWHGDGTLAALVVGIGVNVNQTRDQLPPPSMAHATSLRLEAGRPLARGPLLVSLCERLAVWSAQAPAPVLAAWRGRLATLGQVVAVYSDGLDAPPTLRGRAVEVDADGALVVEDYAGGRHVVHAADVALRTDELAEDGAQTG